MRRLLLSSLVAVAVPAFALESFSVSEGELGYISIEEILSNDGELDFHFEPKPLDACEPISFQRDYTEKESA